MDYSYLEQMLLSRLFEETLEELFIKKQFTGTTHLSIGQEACHVGLVGALDDRDFIVPTHRCHGFNIARGSSIKSLFLELFGGRNGICAGLGGSMHMTDIRTCNAGSSAVVGSGVGLALGLSFANRKLEEDNISVAIFGDGATSRGIVHESMNLASVWNLPLLFFCENNMYGMSASSKNVVASSNIYKRAENYNIKSVQIDGNDLDEVLASVKNAREYILNEKRPYFIEALTYRQCGHSKSDKCVYRSREEEEYWKKKDPINLYCLKHGIAEEELEKRKQKTLSFIKEEYDKAFNEKDDVLSEEELSALVCSPSPDVDIKLSSTHGGNYRQAVYEGIKAILKKDDRAYFIGEDIGRYGGCFGVSRDLYKLFPSRVLDTPVSEEAFTQMAVGAAFRDIHPIIEIMYGDFSTLASDALINHAAKSRFMSNGQLDVPLIYRTPVGSGTGHGAQHTQLLETLFLNVPGLIIATPSDPWSAKALLLAANRERNPVLFFEHKALYDESGEIPDDDVIFPLGKARVLKEGNSLTIVSYSHALLNVMKAVNEIDVDAEVIDLCTIKPWDEETVLKSVKKTKRLLIVQDNPISGSVAEMVASRVSCDKELFRLLEREIRIVSGRDCPIPFSPVLEKSAVPSKEDIIKEIIAFFQNKT